MKTDTSERGLEDLIVQAMTGRVTPPQAEIVGDTSALYGGTGWLLGDWKDYDRDYAVDLKQLSAFLGVTQPKAAAAVDLDHDSPTRRSFLARLQGEISKRETIEALQTYQQLTGFSPGSALDLLLQ